MNSAKNIDIQFMKRALALAGKGVGTVSPNPMVGAIVVKDNIILGEGYHIRSGEGHAEVNAILACGDLDLTGATIYVTLEPCCHTNKKTPPCTSLLIEKKIKRVVVACLDANPEVAGKGLEILKSKSIEVESGVLEEEAKQLNEIFFKYVSTKVPYIHIKLAQTLDGKMSTFSGDSKWISDEDCRREVHELRLLNDAIMIGRQTLNNDNPSLDIRMGINHKNKTPWRIIVGNPEKYNWDTKILSDEMTDKTLIITKNTNFRNSKNIRTIHIKDSISESFEEMGRLGITSILVEGGPHLISTIIEENLYDKITVYVAPKMIGEGISYFKKSNQLMSHAINFDDVKVSVINNQAKFELYKKKTE